MTACDGPAQRRRSVPARSGVALAVLLVMAGCDVPTGLPRFESRWIVPLAATRVGVNELLPTALTVAGDDFRLTLPPGSGGRTLGQLCGAACLPVQGLSVPKPAFSDSFHVTTAMSADVVSVTATAGAATVTLAHNFDFDPLRPDGRSEDGVITLTLRNGARVIGMAVIDEEFPRDIPITRSIVLEPGVIAGSLVLGIAVASPAGGPAVIDSAAAITVTLAPDSVAVAEAQIAVNQRLIAAPLIVLDLTGVDADLRERVRRGVLQVVVNNPFDVAGALQLGLQAATSGADIVRTVQVVPGASMQDVELSLEEVQSLLGHRVGVTLGGRVSATGQAVMVRPGQEVAVTPRLDLIVEIGG